MGETSLLYRECDPQTLRRLAARHFGPVPLEGAALLRGGMFNTTYRLDLADGRRYVLRLGPVNRHLLLPFEHGMMAAEARVYALCREAGVCVPEVAAVSTDRTLVDRDYMLTEFLPAAPLSAFAGDARAAYRALGRMTARLHAIRGARFGRVSQILRGGGYATWGEAMLGELADWASVAVPAGCYDRATVARLEAAFCRCLPALAEVTAPALAHADLWSGNVLVRPDGTLAAIIDADRCLFGDPAFDFAEGWLDQDGFAEGYGPAPAPTRAAAVRRRLYRLLYGLLDGYVYACEYRNPEASERCREKAMGLLEEVEKGE